MKQLLIKLIPNFVLSKLIKYKYKKTNLQIHSFNIKQNKIVKIRYKKNDNLKTILYKSFSGIIKVESYNFYFYPVAIIKVPDKIDEYLQEIGAKSRNMIKKALKNNIECNLFDWNGELNNIFEINRSSLIRQGREMDNSYKEYPKKIDYFEDGDFKIVHIGAYDLINQKLIGYIELYVYGNFAMTNRILGHKQYLKFGVMNLMIKKCVEYAMENRIEYINYLTMQNRKNNSLSAFKNRVGFREYSLLELK